MYFRQKSACACTPPTVNTTWVHPCSLRCAVATTFRTASTITAGTPPRWAGSTLTLQQRETAADASRTRPQPFLSGGSTPGQGGPLPDT
eukprot:gene10183-biopygen4763